MTLVGAFNPDFGQVEVDPAVVNLSAFETFFEEKRPFFLEGIDAFRVEFGVDSLSGTGAAIDYTVATAWEDEDTKEMATNRGDGIPDGPFIRRGTLWRGRPDQHHGRADLGTGAQPG